MSAAGAQEAGKKKGGGLTFHQFPNLSAVVVRGDGRRGVLTVDCGVDVPDSALRKRVDQYEPRLLDAYASSMQVFGANLRPGAAPDLDALSVRLQADTDRILSQRGARFLLGTVLLN